MKKMFIRQLVEMKARQYCAEVNKKFGMRVCYTIPKECTREEVLRILHGADFDGVKDFYREGEK